MPTFTRETRQLYVRESAHERVREYAETNNQNVEDVYQRLVGEIAASPGEAAAPKERKVRGIVRIPDALWALVRSRSETEGIPIGTLVEQRIAKLR